MAKIANDFCKKIYVTDDNPRNESPQKIRNELLKHLSPEKSYNIAENLWLSKDLFKMPNHRKLF